MAVIRTFADWIKQKIKDVYGDSSLLPDIEIFIDLNSQDIINDAHKLDEFGFRLDWTDKDESEWPGIAISKMERHKHQDTCHTLSEPF